MDNYSGDTFKLIGRPMLWQTEVYGSIAVHVTKISPNGRVAVLTIDGGEGSTPAQRFPELADGIGFAILGDLSQRPRQASSRKVAAAVETIEKGIPRKRAPRKAASLTPEFKLATLNTEKEVTF